VAKKKPDLEPAHFFHDDPDVQIPLIIPMLGSSRDGSLTNICGAPLRPSFRLGPNAVQPMMRLRAHGTVQCGRKDNALRSYEHWLNPRDLRQEPAKALAQTLKCLLRLAYLSLF